MRTLLAIFVFGLLASCTTLACAVDVPPPKLAGRKVIELDEPFTAFACGGGGRYYVFHLKAAKKLALLDVSAAEVIKEIDVPADDVMLTAGLDKLIVATPSKNLLHRYELATLKREKSVPITGPSPKHLLLGSASAGPLVTWGQTGPIALLDLETLKPRTVKGDMLGGDPMYDFQLTTSADGQTICGWTGGISGQQFHVMRLKGDTTTMQKSPGGFSDNGRWLRPTYDGTLMFQNGAAIYPPNMQPVSPDHFKGDYLYPAEDPRFFFAIAHYENDKNCQAWLCTVGGLEKMISVVDIGHVKASIIASDHGHIRMQPRVRWIPSANVLVSIPEGQKTIVLCPANLEKMLKDRGGEYLHVISNPPRAAKVGKAYEYRLEALTSAKGKVSYKVESGPSGCKISGDKLTWTPKERPAEGVEKLVVVASAKGDMESFHSWEIAVEK